MASKAGFSKQTLTRLLGTVSPVPFTVCDIEASSGGVKIYALGFYDPSGGGPEGDGFYRFEGKRAAIDFLRFYLQERYAGIRCYAHNGGRYDFTFFLKYIAGELREEGWQVEITTLQSSAFRLDFSNPAYPGKTWTFLDSVRLMPMSLQKLGETFRLGRKVEIVLDRRPGETKYDALGRIENRELAWKYNKQDCLLLYMCIDRFQTMLNALGAKMQGTAPATAMDLFRRRFLGKSTIYLNRHFEPCKELHLPPVHRPQVASTRAWLGGNKVLLPGKRYRIWPNAPGTKLPLRIDELPEDEEICKGCGHEFLQEFMQGGRSEIFRLRGRHLRYYDVNSHYPNCMLEKMPVGKATVFERGESDSEEDIRRRAKSLIGFVHCKAWIPESTYLPPLPVRTADKLLFPTGTVVGHWTTAELEALWEVGGKIVEVYRQAWFQGEHVFNEYIASMYALRQKDHPDFSDGLSYIAKLMMNALFGKFATKVERKRLVVLATREAYARGLQFSGYAFEDAPPSIFAEKITIDPDYRAPAISAYITSLGRVRLWRILSKVLALGGHVHYCDTDSGVCDVDLPAELQGKNLGQLKLEHRIQSAEFARPKLYQIVCEGAKEIGDVWRSEGKEGLARLARDKPDRICPCFFEWFASVKDRTIVGKWDGETPGQAELWHGYHIKNKGFSSGLDGIPMDLAEWRRLTSLQMPTFARTLTSKRFATIRELAGTKTMEPRIISTPKAIRSDYDKRTVCDDGIDTRAVILHDDWEIQGATGVHKRPSHGRARDKTWPKPSSRARRSPIRKRTRTPQRREKKRN